MLCALLAKRSRLLRQLQQCAESDNTRPILDTLFALARSTLDPADAQTYEPAYNYLLRCSHLIGPGSVSATVSASGANWIRCVSGAFYHLAGTLYQSGRYGGAVRFLKEGCLLGVKALNAIREVRKGNGKGAGKAEAIENVEEWKSLEEQLYRRWELLAVSYSKIGERRVGLHMLEDLGSLLIPLHQMAFQAYLECVKTFPYSSTPSSSTLDFRASPAMKQLGNLVDKLTYLATCDLLLEPNQVSLRTHLSSADLGHGILGELVERQLDCLDPYLWKRDVTEVFIRLLGHALELYQDRLALRRARVLLRCLELTYNVGPETVLVYGWDPEEMGREVGRILERNVWLPPQRCPPTRY
jgi:separase